MKPQFLPDIPCLQLLDSMKYLHGSGDLTFSAVVVVSFSSIESVTGASGLDSAELVDSLGSLVAGSLTGSVLGGGGEAL